MNDNQKSEIIKNRKCILNKQPLNCPWLSKTPFPAPFQSKEQINCKMNPQMNKMTADNSTPMNCRYNSPVPVPNVLHHHPSITQFFNFFRLMQLFPEIHPATLHTVLFICKNDFFCAFDKLLHIKKLRQIRQPFKTQPNDLRNKEHPYWNVGNKSYNADGASSQVENIPKKLVHKVILLPQGKNVFKSENESSAEFKNSDDNFEKSSTETASNLSIK